MAMKLISVKFTGISPLLQNNPRGANPFDPYTKASADSYNRYKKSKTEENFIENSRLGVRTKMFWDDDMGIYVPTRWVSASLGKKAYAILGKGYSKDAIRGGVFTVKEKVKLHYDGENKVKKEEDVYLSDQLTTQLILPQGAIRQPKSFPIFHKWSFEVELEYDDKIIDATQIQKVLEYTAKYNGFGDFRPSYGRCLCEVTYE